jgi:hypothetical protein
MGECCWMRNWSSVADAYHPGLYLDKTIISKQIRISFDDVTNGEQ